MQYFDPEINQNYVPYVMETSIGLDRMLPDGAQRSL